MKSSAKKFAITVPSSAEPDLDISIDQLEPVKLTGRKPVVSRKKKASTIETLPDDANKNTILQNISSVLEAKGISHEASKHQDVINISEGYKKKIYISRPGTKTNSHCYFCRQSIEEHPIGNPVRVEKKKYILEGVFCSFNCLLAFHLEQNNIRYRESGIHIHTIYRELYGKKMDLVASKSWKLLKEYGGELTRKEWKRLTEPFVELENDVVDKYNNLVIFGSEMFIGD
jgi:hypothetical protein